MRCVNKIRHHNQPHQKIIQNSEQYQIRLGYIENVSKTDIVNASIYAIFIKNFKTQRQTNIEVSASVAALPEIPKQTLIIKVAKTVKMLDDKLDVLVDIDQESKVNMSQSKQSQNKEKNNQNLSKQNVNAKLFQIPDDIKKMVNKNRMILVMDLDQTMVFTRRRKPPKHNNYVVVNINQNITYVQFRPHIADFLEAVSHLFTIYVYTAGSQAYADAVLDILPNGKVISKRFYRESCIYHKGTLIKDLKVIHRTFEQITPKNQPQKLAILVDDNGLSISYNSPHSVKIRAFEGNQQDRYLEDIFARLMEYYRQYCTEPQNMTSNK